LYTESFPLAGTGTTAVFEMVWLAEAFTIDSAGFRGVPSGKTDR
jgi:hypothetical protein